MRTPLKSGAVIRLNEIGTVNGYDFKIEEMIGMGGSCIVYTAVYTDLEGNRFPVRLKEFYPEWLDLHRDNLALVIPDEKAEDFSESIRQFSDSYQKQMQFRKLPESMNSIANIQGIYEGNGTKYIAMSCQNAIKLDDADLSLYDIFRVIRAVTLQIANFHDNGYLYLDLKPQNVMLYPETPEMVMLFDFDSAMPLDDIQPAHLSCTDGWAAPELEQHKYREIGVGTDIYGIGALLMYLLFHRAPNISDRRRGITWEDGFDNSLLKSEKPEIRRTIKEIFSKTFAVNPKKRFTTCDNLLDIIEPLIEEYQKPKPYLKTFLPLGNNFFCGRDTEILEIHDALSQNNFMVLHGIGGIGKSELVKHYALTYNDVYDAVIFVRFRKNIMETVVLDSNFPIANCTRSEAEEDEEYFERKIKVLQEICTPRHLIILDNFDTEDCENLDALTALFCKILITSRVDYSDIFPQFELDVIKNYDDLFSIMTYYYKTKPDAENTAAMNDIISAVLGHTMALELIAKHMQAMEISPIEMYNLLAESGITASNEGKVRGFKDGNLKSKTAYAHIAALFNIFGLTEDMKQVLRYMALIGPTPMAKEGFIDLTPLTDAQFICLNTLIQRGWIQTLSVSDEETIKLHPLISDVLCEELKPDTVHCDAFIRICHFYIHELDNLNYHERMVDFEWLDHMAHHICGISRDLAIFYFSLCHEVYLVQHDYDAMEWCEQHVTEIFAALNLSEDEPDGLAMLYTTMRTAAYHEGKSEQFTRYTNLLHQIGSDFALEQIAFQDEILYSEEQNDEAAYQAALTSLHYALQSGDDLKIANVYHDLATNSAFLNRNDEADLYHDKALKHIKQYLELHSMDEKSDDLAQMYNDAASVFRGCGDLSAALYYQKKSIDIIEMLHGEKTGASMREYCLIGQTYLLMHEYDSAIEYCKVALDIALRTYGKIHPKNNLFYRQLSQAYDKKWQNTGDIAALKQASELIQEWIEMQIELTFEGSDEVAALHMKYAEIQRILNTSM